MAVPNIGRSLIINFPLNMTSNMTVQSKKIGQTPSNFIYEFDVRRKFAVKLTGLERGYFGGKTMKWDNHIAKMGFVSSFPTSYRITHDPLTVDVFLNYLPENFVPFQNHPFQIM